MIKTLYLGNLDGHHKWRGGCTRRRLRSKGEIFTVVWNNHSEDEDGEDVEEEDPVEGHFDCFRHYYSRVLGLTDGNADKFSPRKCIKAIQECQHTAR